MACGCCGPKTCKCKVSNNANDENQSFTNYNFSYINNMQNAPWIHMDYPKPLFNQIYDQNNNQYVAANAVYDKDGKIIFEGDYSYYTRNGLPAVSSYGGWAVKDYNGDNSVFVGKVYDPIPLTVFALEEKQDINEKECQLWIKFRNVTFDNQQPVLSDWGNEILLHSTKWDTPANSEFIIDLPSFYFNGPNKVELKFQCINPCQIANLYENSVTLNISGQADWITESQITYPLDPCKSYGSFNGISTADQTCMDPVMFPKIEVNNKSSKIALFSSFCSYYGPSLHFWFSPVGDGLCNESPSPCIPNFTFGNSFGGYIKNADGTTSCGSIFNVIGDSYFFIDVFNSTLIDKNNAIFKGTWTNGEQNVTMTYDCQKQKYYVTPYWKYKEGTIEAISS